METITSTSNTQVRAVGALRRSARERAKQDLFIAEGLRWLREVPGQQLERVYASESFARRHEPELMALPETKMIRVSDAVMEKMADTQTPQGVLCLIRMVHYRPEDLLRADVPSLCLALEDLQDPGNLGTIFRSAEAAGVTGLLLSAGCVDPYNPKVVRSTMGSLLRVPFCIASDFRSALRTWQAGGLTLYAAHLQGRADYTQEDYRRPSGFLIGNEGRGLTDETAQAADVYIRIPMCGRVESLNASVAASLLAYEAHRQRAAASL